MVAKTKAEIQKALRDKRAQLYTKVVCYIPKGKPKLIEKLKAYIKRMGGETGSG